MSDPDLLPLLPDLAVFARVVDAGSFALAARQLGTAPSTVSRTVQRLEAALATRLLERTTRRLRVTAAGAQVARHARDMLGAAADALDAAGQARQQPRGSVSLSAPTEFAQAVVHPVLPAFLRSWPEVALRLVASDAALDPLEHGLDLVLRLTDAPPPHLAGRPLGTVHWRLCAAPAYLAARGMPRTPVELAAHDGVVLGETPQDRRWRLRRVLPQGGPPDSAVMEMKGRYAVNHAQARLDAAVQGLGIAALPDFLAAGALAQGTLQPVLPDWALEAHAYAGRVWLLYPPNRFLPPKVRVLIDHLAAHLPARLAVPAPPAG